MIRLLQIVVLFTVLGIATGSGLNKWMQQKTASIQLDIEELKKNQEFTANKELALEQEIQIFFQMLPEDKKIEFYIRLQKLKQGK